MNTIKLKVNTKTVVVNLLLLFMILSGCGQPRTDRSEGTDTQESVVPDWKSQLRETLKIYGHRNWIVVADAAYPEQSNPAIETVFIDADQLEAVAFVSDLIENANHVDANIFIDKEMESVPEKNAKGIEAYRNALNEMLEGKPVKRMLHEDIIKKLDASAKLFNVFIVKTDLAIPYTSVFFQLECGYWNATSEDELRKEMEGVDLK